MVHLLLLLLLLLVLLVHIVVHIVVHVVVHVVLHLLYVHVRPDGVGGLDGGGRDVGTGREHAPRVDGGG